jgi:hypothetical protein
VSGQLGPKPDPGARMYPLPQYLMLRAWSWLTWPWQARQLKRAGLIRTGWRTWETP